MSNKAINKFAKFTATKPPAYKVNAAGLSKKVNNRKSKEELLESIKNRANKK